MPKTYDAIRTCKRQRRTPMRSPICSLEAPAKLLLPKHKKRVASKKCQPRFGTKQGPKNVKTICRIKIIAAAQKSRLRNVDLLLQICQTPRDLTETRV